MGAGVGVYAFAYFTPLILVGMGFHTSKEIYLLSAPPNLAAIPYAFGIAWLADHYKIRAPFIIFQSLTSIVGLMLTAYHPRNGVKYFGVFLGVAGCNGNLPAILAWQANNIRGQSTRA
jgi:cyanate permease